MTTYYLRYLVNIQAITDCWTKFLPDLYHLRSYLTLLLIKIMYVRSSRLYKAFIAIRRMPKVPLS